MFDFNKFENGCTVSAQTMCQIFGAMMHDRDTMDIPEWMGRYSGFIVDTARIVNSMKGNDALNEDEILKFAAHIAHMVYTKKYDEEMNATDWDDFNDFMKESQGKRVASS